MFETRTLTESKEIRGFVIEKVDNCEFQEYFWTLKIELTITKNLWVNSITSAKSAKKFGLVK